MLAFNTLNFMIILEFNMIIKYFKNFYFRLIMTIQLFKIIYKNFFDFKKNFN